MSKHLSLFLGAVLVVIVGITASAAAADMMKTVTMNGLRVELHVLPAEPFFTAKEVEANQVKEGMLIMGGAKPVALNAASQPNHHLVAHVFDVKTGKAITKAKVRINYQELDSKGKPHGAVVHVPVVIMQAIGKGPESTHYGNNVMMPDGTYVITVIVNGKKMEFQMAVSKSVKDKN